MRRPARKRIHVSGIPYYVTVVFRNRNTIFSDPAHCDLFLQVLENQRKRYGFLLHEYVLMPDHYHAILTPPDGFTISDTIRHINGIFALHYNKINQHQGQVLQARFWDHGIRNGRDYNEKARYIHENPVKAGMVSNPEDYPWSSAKERLTGKPGFLALDPIP